MKAYRQWLQGVRRRGAVRWHLWHWVEDAVLSAPVRRVAGFAAALATAVVLGVAAGAAATRSGACQAAEADVLGHRVAGVGPSPLHPVQARLQPGAGEPSTLRTRPL